MSLLIKFLQNFQGYLQISGLFDYNLRPLNRTKEFHDSL